MEELLADFVAETREMLEASEGEIIAWESDPSDRARLDTIFRFVHTVKGNCGFFDFPRLAALSHAAEDALAECRMGKREPDAALVSAVLAIIDRIVAMVDAIEAGSVFPDGGDEALVAALEPGASDDTESDTVLDRNTNGAHQSALTGDTHVDIDAEPGSDVSPSSVPAVQRSIRLPVELLDRVMSGVSDMVLARNDLAHRLRQAGNQPTIDGPFERLTTILSDVRDAITRMRMQRVETLFAGLPRLVRDLSSALGKQVEIKLQGGDVELDREMIEMIRDPITHVLRNAIDHGIEAPADRVKAGKLETGLITIAARQSGNTILITISDDGSGLDAKRIAEKGLATGLVTAKQRAAMSREAIFQLVFHAGFSTAEKVSSVSGRGVGLDVVRDNIERLGGGIEVSSEEGNGTTFTLNLPLTLTIIPGLTVEFGTQRYAIPQGFIEEIVHASSASLDFTHVGDTALVTFRGQRVPCLMLGDVLGLPASDVDPGEGTLVLLRLASGDLFALGVDRIHAHGDLVVKPLAPVVAKSAIYAGSSLLDDGEPVLLLDIGNIADQHDLATPAQERAVDLSGPGEAGKGATVTRAMVVTAFDDQRCAVRLDLVRRIETASVSIIDRSGGRPHAVIDGNILPVAGLSPDQPKGDKQRFLRLFDGACEILLAVSEIEDAVELTGVLKPVDDDPKIEAVTLVEGRPVALLDAHALFARHGDRFMASERPRCRLPTSDWARSFLAPLVVSAGYDIAGASDEGEDVIIMFEGQEEATVAHAAPVIRLREAAQVAGATHTIYRYDRDGVLNALREAREVGGAA